MYEELLNDFDESVVDPSNTVVRCASQHEADMFLKYLNAKGIWDERQIKILSKCWANHGSSTCYHLSNPSWCHVEWYEENRSDLYIVDFCHIHKESREKMGLTLSFDELMQGVI